MAENSKTGLIRKALWIWAVQYHFQIPEEMLERYVHKYRHERYNIAHYGQRFFNPENKEEYHKWLTFQSYPESKDHVKYHVLFPSEKLDLSDVNVDYCLIEDGNVELYEQFDGSLSSIRGDVIYFDSDRIDEREGRILPSCKPDFAYDVLRGFNYIGPVWMVKTDVLRQFEGQKWNPYRWLLELSDQKVEFEHVSKILYGVKDQEKCEAETVREYLKDHEIKADVTVNEDGITDTVRYQIEGKPLVSIIIPTKDSVSVLKTCIDSVLAKTVYDNYEIVIADNGSKETETLQYFTELQKEHKNIFIVNVPGGFNFSRINNEAIRKSNGEYVVMLNNDTAVITGNWLEEMLSYAQRDNVGAVGALLYYGDNTIQHAGVIAGKGGGFAHRYYRKPYDTKGYDHTLDIPYDQAAVTAACLMVSRKHFEDVNGMNEELTVQFNDCDFCLRLYEKGCNSVFLPYVKLYHYESKSRGIDKAPEKVKRFREEVDYVNQKWGSYMKHDPFYNDQYDTNYDYRLIAGTGSN